METQRFLFVCGAIRWSDPCPMSNFALLCSMEVSHEVPRLQARFDIRDAVTQVLCEVDSIPTMAYCKI